MSKRDNARSAASSVRPHRGQPAAPEPSRATECEEWAWMVDEDPAFYLEEARPALEKRGG